MLEDQTSFLAAYSGVTHVPPQSQPLQRFTPTVIPKRSASLKVCRNRLAPRLAQEHRPLGRLGPPSPASNSSTPEMPCCFMAANSAGNSLAAGRAVQPPPVGPWPGGIRRPPEGAAQPAFAGSLRLSAGRQQRRTPAVEAGEPCGHRPEHDCQTRLPGGAAPNWASEIHAAILAKLRSASSAASKGSVIYFDTS